MGQAKLRKAEIDALKASKTTVQFLAVRYCENGETEFAHAEVQMGKPRNDKNSLLQHICMNDWVHTPPVQHIAEYLLQTKTYEMFSKFSNGDEGYIIHFYEVDEEFSRKNGQKTFSCRDIMSVPRDALKEYARKLADELKAAGDYSVEEYA